MLITAKTEPSYFHKSLLLIRFSSWRKHGNHGLGRYGLAAAETDQCLSDGRTNILNLITFQLSNFFFFYFIIEIPIVKTVRIY